MSAAPAFAAASDTLVFTPAPTGTWSLNNDRMTASIPVKNTSTNDQPANLQLVVTFPNVYVFGERGQSQPFHLRTSAGWWSAVVQCGYSGTGTNRTATVVFTANTQVGIALRLRP